MILNHQAPMEGAARRKGLISLLAIFSLISTATAVMMLCPCDSVGLHDHYAISLVTTAGLFGLGAAVLVYRRMQRDSGATAFLRALVSLVIVGVGIFAELFLAMQVVAWLAQRSR